MTQTVGIARPLARVLLTICWTIITPAAQADPSAAFVGRWLAVGARPIAGVTIFRTATGLSLQLIGDCGQPPCASPPSPLNIYVSKTQRRGLAIWSNGSVATHASINASADRLLLELFEITSSKDARVKTRATLARADDIVNSAYQAEFGRSFKSFAVHVDRRDDKCRVEPGVTSTAYRRVTDEWSELLVLRFDKAGSLLRKNNRRVLTPAGRFRVLTFVLDYPTLGPNFDQWWRAAQVRINEEHVAFAKSRGYKMPLVQFDNTNFRVPLSVAPNRLQDAQRAAEEAAIRVVDFQIFVTLDINPKVIVGGRSDRMTRSVYVGNFFGSTTAPTEQQWHQVAATVYHHEIGHLWGWEHDWAQDCAHTEYAPFITDPVLFGWEDVDGDGIPEINDPTPYGMSNKL